MPTFLQSIGDRWKASPQLCELMPYARVFTGRIPSTEEYPFPYVSIAQGALRVLYRTDKTQGYNVPVAFHIWCDDTAVAAGERIAAALTAAFAEGGWTFDNGPGQGKVLDILDGGPAETVQENSPTIKAWQFIKVMTFMVERRRVDSFARDDESFSDASSEQFSTSL